MGFTVENEHLMVENEHNSLCDFVFYNACKQFVVSVRCSCSCVVYLSCYSKCSFVAAGSII